MVSVQLAGPVAVIYNYMVYGLITGQLDSSVYSQ